MRALFEETIKLLNSGVDVMLATIAERKGSAPRSKAASMIVTVAGGRVSGTIGGGAIENETIKYAINLIQEKQSGVHDFCLRANDVEDIGMICGGDVKMYFKYIAHDDDEMLEKLIGGELRIEYEKGKYIDLTTRQNHVYIFGGGHVTQGFVPIVSKLDFYVIVCEDREEFAKKELFQGADEVRYVPIEKLVNVCKEMTKEDFVCFLTRGHDNDYALMCETLRTEVPYMGIIGSKRKRSMLFEWLKADGFTDTDLARIKTPIGLDILAETPEEIGVSISAELIQERAKIFK
jgi:xanthine dehydrogenase accessory factor